MSKFKEFIDLRVKDGVKDGASGLPFSKDQYEHKVIVDDLVVTFPMDEEEISRQIEKRERYQAAIAMPSIKDQVGLKEFLKNNSLGMTPEEMQQVEKYALLSGNGYPNESWLENSIAIGHTELFINLMAKQNTRYMFLRSQSHLRDRQGEIFTLLREFMRNNPNPPNTRPDFRMTLYKNNIYYASLARYVGDQLMFTALMAPDSTCHELKETTSLTKDKIKFHRFKTPKDSVDFFTTKDFMANKDTPFVPTGEYYGHTSAMVPFRYRVPSLKKICFGVLKEKFLINKQSLLDIIKSLPVNLVADFCSSCGEDETPVGHEVLEYLEQGLRGTHFEASYDELFPFHLMATAMTKRFKWANEAMSSDIIQSAFHPQYSSTLINVYDNIQLFVPKTVPDHFIILPATPSKSPDSIGACSIVDHATFLANFHANTGNIFANLSWSNMVVIGGIVTRSLLGSTAEGFDSSDIDIYFYNEDKRLEAARRIIDALPGDKSTFSFTHSDSQITVSRHYPHRHIQINMLFFRSIEHILSGTDIDATNFAFDGTQLWTTSRGVEAMNYRANLATSYGQAIRGDNIYQRRLLKYTRRGFSVAYIPTDAIIEKSRDYVKSANQNGLAALLSARDSETVLQEMLTRNEKSSLPYGPTWNKANMDPKVSNNYNANYDGYNSSVWPNVLESIDDLESVWFTEDPTEVYLYYDWETFLDQEQVTDYMYQLNPELYDEEDEDDEDEE
eukprot:gene16150-19217_t